MGGVTKHVFYISMQSAYGTLKQNLIKFKYTQVINKEVKPSRSHLMTQKMQISVAQKMQISKYLEERKSF